MNRIEKIKLKIQKLDKLLTELKNEVQLLDNELQKKKNKRVIKKQKDIPSIDVLKSEYEDLYKLFLNQNSKVVNDFIASKDRVYLIELCKANNIVLDSSKRSQTKMAEEIIQWFVQRKAITKKIK